MQADDHSASWVKDLEKAFAPYPSFVESVVEHLAKLELSYSQSEAELAQVKAELAQARAVQSTPIERPVRISNESKSDVPAKVRKVLPEKRVLLVDDAEINRVLMSHYFKGLPVKLDFAPSGEAALSKCKDSQFDLIVIDDELKNPNSPDLAKLLKAEGVSAILVALSNQSEAQAPMIEFSSVLNRGLSRELFVERLKSYLWAA